MALYVRVVYSSFLKKIYSSTLNQSENKISNYKEKLLGRRRSLILLFPAEGASQAGWATRAFEGDFLTGKFIDQTASLPQAIGGDRIAFKQDDPPWRDSQDITALRGKLFFRNINELEASG